LGKAPDPPVKHIAGAFALLVVLTFVLLFFINYGDQLP
jgi:hypothetical protein